MAQLTERKTATNIVDISHIPCPACGRSDRWDAIETREEPEHNPELIVTCDCGVGELKIVVE